MATEIRMPQLSDTMDAGKILSWNKQEGDQVERGDILAEVETDKANLEIESFHVGTLIKIVVPEGTNAQVGSVIAYIGNEGEEIPAAEASIKAEDKTAAEPDLQLVKKPESTESTSVVAQQESVSVESDSSRPKASPLARKLAKEANIDLKTIHGSGPQGRVIKKDVELMLSEKPLKQAISKIEPVERVKDKPSPAVIPGSSAKLSKMRETIARRMVQSVQEIPHFYTTVSINMTQAAQFRNALKERDDFKGISYNHLVIKAVGYALEQEPRVNCSYQNGEIQQPSSINVGVITALEDGLLIPVIHDVPNLSLKDLVFEARAAVDRARAGRPSSADLSGGTFSISNMGMLDVENFTAIINPGQGAVLAVSSIQEAPIIKDGNIMAGLQMKVTLSVDHRIIDGIMAGRFLGHFKQALETPALMLV